MKTLQERYLEALVKRGEREVERTHKHIKVTRTQGVARQTLFYFLGKAGSFRVGATKRASSPVRDDFKKALLATLEKAA